MNERIRELEQQAEKFVMSIPASLDINEYTSVFNAKFAELIVRECMKLNRDILCEDDPDYLDKVYKEHFGVEQ